MSNTVEWKVEALTDGRNWSDISSYVQSLNINIGKPDDVDEFDTGSASVTLDNRDGRFDPESPFPQYTGRGRINYVSNPASTNGTPTFWSFTDDEGVSFTPAPYIGSYSGSIEIGNGYAVNSATAYFDNSVYDYNYIYPKGFNDGLYVNDEWTVSADIAFDYITGVVQQVGVGFEILDEGFNVIQRYVKNFEKTDVPEFVGSTMQRYSATFTISYFFPNPPKYIRAIVFNENFTLPQDAFFKNVLLERTGEVNDYFDGDTDVQTYFGTSWLGTADQSPSFYWTDKPFDIGTEIKISARRDSELFVPKFYGYVSALDFNDSADNYPIVTLNLVDKTASYTTRPVQFSGYKQWALNANPYIFFNDVPGLSVPTVNVYEYQSMSRIFSDNSKSYFQSEPSWFPYGSFANRLFDSTHQIRILNTTSFLDNQEPIAIGLSRSTLVVHSGTTDLISPTVDGYDLENGLLRGWIRPLSGVQEPFIFSSWFLPVTIPVGGLTLWELATEKVININSNLETDLTNSFEVILNPDGSMSFRSTTPAGVATTTSTSAGLVDTSAPLNITISAPDSNVAPGTGYPIYAYVNGQFVLDLTGLINTTPTGGLGYFRIAGTAGGSFYMSDFHVAYGNATGKGGVQPSYKLLDFVEGYNYATNIDYENLNDKADFITNRSSIELEVPQRRFNDTDTDSENLLQTQFYEQSTLDALKSLSNASYGYLSINYENNKSEILTRSYLQENTQLTSYTFSDFDIQPNELKFKEISFERNNELVSNIIQLRTPQKFDTNTKLPLQQKTSYLATNPNSIRQLGNRFVEFNTVDVKEDVSEGYVQWRNTALGSINNKIRFISFADGEANETEAIVNMKLGQKAILKITPAQTNNPPTRLTKNYRITRIGISATPDRTICDIGLLELENETMAILGTATTDESRLGF